MEANVNLLKPKPRGPYGPSQKGFGAPLFPGNDVNSGGRHRAGDIKELLRATSQDGDQKLTLEEYDAHFISHDNDWRGPDGD
ncbi:unnamed protein product [Caretta caretta]